MRFALALRDANQLDDADIAEFAGWRRYTRHGHIILMGLQRLRPMRQGDAAVPVMHVWVWVGGWATLPSVARFQLRHAERGLLLVPTWVLLCLALRDWCMGLSVPSVACFWCQVWSFSTYHPHNKKCRQNQLSRHRTYLIINL